MFFLIEKFKEWLDKLLGNERLQLPAQTSNLRNAGRRKLKEKTQATVRGIDIAREYKELLNENERIQQKLDDISLRIELRANKIPIDESVVDLKAYYNEKKGIDKVKSTTLSDGEKKQAQKFSWNFNAGRYFNESMQMWFEYKSNQQKGKATVLNDEQSKRIEEMDEFIRLNISDAKNSGRILGIKYAAFSNGLTTDKKNRQEVAEIERLVDELSRIGELYRLDSEIIAIEREGITEIDRIMFTSDRVVDGMNASMYLIEVENIRECATKYAKYIQGGSKVNLEDFQEEPRTLKDSVMTDKEKGNLLERADQQGIPHYPMETGTRKELVLVD